jgi:predicted secreted acid phosphatase
MGKKLNVYDLAYMIGTGYLDTITLKQSDAVMFDIDDTLLNTTNYKPIKPIIKLLKRCSELGLIIVIITARDSRYTRGTIDDLENLNLYPVFNKKDFVFPKDALFYDYLYLRHSPEENHDLFKSDVKKRLLDEFKLRIVMSVGDNEIDVVGNYSGFGIKLPNERDPRLFYKRLGTNNLIPVN